MGTGQTGTSLGGKIQKSPARAKRDAAARRRQDKRWAAKAGPVTTTYVCPACGGPHPRAECPTAS